MGGKAAESLIHKTLSQHPSNEGKKLKYRSISNSELDQILPIEYGKFVKDDNTIVGYILNELISAGMIDPTYYPKFVLGSTRLAAISKYGIENIEVDDFETGDVVQNALSKKTSFGDLDIDVAMTKPLKEIANFLNSLKPGALAAKLGGLEVHLAVKMDDFSVLQVDLVNVSEGDVSSEKFMQYSSFLDLSQDIKGVFATILLRAVANAKQPENLSYFEEFVESNPDTDFSNEWNKITDAGYTPNQARYVVSPKNLKLAVEFEKEGVKTVKKLFFPDFKRSYKDLDTLAKFLLGERAQGPELLHATSLAEFVKNNFSQEQIRFIEEKFVDVLEKSVKRGLDPESYETGKNAVLKILNPKENNKELVNEGRQGIGRFIGSSKFTNKSALEIIYHLIHQSNNVGKENITIDLTEDTDKVDMVEKMDSNFISIGIDRRGQFFVESSNSGLVYPSTYKQKFHFSVDFLKSYESLMTNDGLQSALKQIFDRFGSFKLNSELFPVLTHEGTADGRVIFVGTPYLRDNFGSEGGLTVFNAQLWDKDKNSWYNPDSRTNSRILKGFKRLSIKNDFANEWKVYSNDEDMLLPGQIKLNLRGLGSFFRSKETLEELAGLVRKSEYKQRFNEIKEQLQQQLDNFANISTSNLGGDDSYMEGVVLRIKKDSGDFYEVKGTSEEFDEKKKRFWKSRVELLNLEKDFNDSLVVNVLGLPSSHPTVVKRIISSFVFSDYVNNETLNKKDFIFNLLKAGIIFSNSNMQVEEIKEKLLSLIQNAEVQLKEIVNSTKNQDLDRDTRRKTLEIYKSVSSKVRMFKRMLQIPDDEDFIVDFVYTVLEKRLSKIINLEDSSSYQKDDTEREKVIVIPGRFQPFHKGHKKMVDLAVEALPEIGGDKVLIYVVKGNTSSLDNDKNPLSEKEQIDLISSLFKDNPKVEVSQDVIPTAHANAIIPNIYDKGLKLVGLAAGPDRLPQYKQFVYAFSPSYFKSDHEYTPIDKNEKGHYLFKFIETPRVYSGTEARKAAKTTDFEDFLDNVIGSNVSKETKEIYNMIYNKLKEKESQEEKENYLEETQYHLGVFCGLIEQAILESNNDGTMFGVGSGLAGSRGYWKAAPDDDEPREDLNNEEVEELNDELLEEDELEEITVAAAVGGYSLPLGAKPKKVNKKKKELEEMTNKLTNYLLKIMEK